ncbi:hypothetical protein ACMFMG_008548 [Clarireedia jacksonii]
MVSERSGHRLPTLSETHEWWKYNPKGRELNEFFVTLEKHLESYRPLNFRTHPKPHHGTLNADDSDKKKLNLAIDPCNSSYFDIDLQSVVFDDSSRVGPGPPGQHLNLQVTHDMCFNKTFRKRLLEVKFDHALTSMDYLQNLECRRKSCLRDAKERLRNYQMNCNNFSHTDADATTWAENIRIMDMAAETLYVDVFLGLRFWTMLNELIKPFNKPNIFVMLNTLFPTKCLEKPHKHVTSSTMQYYRSVFYYFTLAVEQKGGSVTKLFLEKYEKNHRHGWESIRETLEDYFELSYLMIDQSYAIPCRTAGASAIAPRPLLPSHYAKELINPGISSPFSTPDNKVWVLYKYQNLANLAATPYHPPYSRQLLPSAAFLQLPDLEDLINLQTLSGVFKTKDHEKETSESINPRHATPGRPAMSRHRRNRHQLQRDEKQLPPLPPLPSEQDIPEENSMGVLSPDEIYAWLADRHKLGLRNGSSATPKNRPASSLKKQRSLDILSDQVYPGQSTAAPQISSSANVSTNYRPSLKKPKSFANMPRVEEEIEPLRISKGKTAWPFPKLDQTVSKAQVLDRTVNRSFPKRDQTAGRAQVLDQTVNWPFPEMDQTASRAQVLDQTGNKAQVLDQTVSEAQVPDTVAETGTKKTKLEKIKLFFKRSNCTDKRPVEHVETIEEGWFGPSQPKPHSPLNKSESSTVMENQNEEKEKRKRIPQKAERAKHIMIDTTKYEQAFYGPAYCAQDQ